MPIARYAGPNVNWQPGPEVKAMDGQALPSGLDFPVAPPPEIGRVSRAASDLRAGRWVPSFPMRVGGVAVVLVAAAVTVRWAVHRMPPGGKPALPDVLLAFVPIVVALLALASLIRKRWVAYVGDAGAAVLSSRGGRSDVRGPWFRFADVSDVQVQAQPRDKGWIEWKLRVVGGDGADLLRLRGNAKRLGNKIVPSTVYAIASAIHEAWKQRSTPPAS